MATVTHRVATASTSNTTSYTSGAFTPAVGDLLVVQVLASGTVAAATCTDSQGGTYTRITTCTQVTSADTGYLFVANQTIPAATSTTVTFDCTGDAATGTVIAVASVSGMSRTGASAVKQTKVASNQSYTVTPSVTFDATTDTNNPTFGMVACGGSGSVNPPGVAPPSGWTEGADVGYTLPGSGLETCWLASGFASTTVTWVLGPAAGTYGVIIAELDASVPGSPVSVLAPLAAMQAVKASVM